MSMNYERHRGRAIALAASASCLAGLLTLVVGCGSSTYAEKFASRLSELQRLSPYSSLAHDPTDDLPVNFRVPASMTAHVYNLYSADPDDAAKYVARDRVLPPFWQEGVGFRRTYEGKYQQNPTNSSPYFLYVWMFDSPRPKDGLEKMRDLVRLKLRDTKANWEPVEVKTPDGKTLNWQRLQVKGDQSFLTEHNGSASDETVAGVFDLWYFETPGWDVLLGWRATVDAWDNAKSGDSKISELPQVVAGTVTFTPDQSRNKKPVLNDGTGIFAPRQTSADKPAPSAEPATATPAAGPAPSNNVHSGPAPNVDTAAKEPPAEDAAGPDGVLRRFLVALMTHDEAEIRATTVENPDLAVLWQSDPASAIQADVAKQLLSAVTFQHLKVGDEVQVPGAGKLAIDQNQVNDNRQQVTVSGYPGAFAVIKAADGWRVDAGLAITARKAIAAATAAPPAIETQKAADAAPPRARLRPMVGGGPASGPAPSPEPAGPAAAGPAASGPAAPPAKQGPAQIEFAEGVSGSIEFPAGFQQNGKSPEASTAPPMAAGPAAAVEPSDSIKIQVVKLGQGVVFNTLRTQAITTELQGAVGGKALERGTGTVAGQTGDFIAIAIANPAGAAGNAGNNAPRKRIIYLANIPAKHLAVKISAEMADASYKTLKEELKKCVRSLKFE
jgi:hypothetical protein